MKHVLILSIIGLCGCETVPIPGPAGEQGTRGETGPQGPAGDMPRPYVRWAEEYISQGQDTAVFVRCDEGDHLLSGGCNWGESPRATAGYPITGLNPDTGELDLPTAWVCITHGIGADDFVHARAICIAGGE
jgi:hypothetical protein